MAGSRNTHIGGQKAGEDTQRQAGDKYAGTPVSWLPFCETPGQVEAPGEAWLSSSH